MWETTGRWGTIPQASAELTTRRKSRIAVYYCHIYMYYIYLCQKNEGKWLSRRVVMCSSLVTMSTTLADAEPSLMLCWIQWQILVTVCSSISHCLFLIVKNFPSTYCRVYLRSPRSLIQVLPAAQPRVWGKFCLFGLCLFSFGLI